MIFISKLNQSFKVSFFILGGKLCKYYLHHYNGDEHLRLNVINRIFGINCTMKQKLW